MSGEEHPRGPVSQEKGDIRGGSIAVIGIAAVCIGVVAVLLEGYWWRTRLHPHPLPSGGYSLPSASTPIEQATFRARARGIERRRTARAALGSYGYVNRSDGMVHVPIERAIDSLLEDAQYGGFAVHAVTDGGADTGAGRAVDAGGSEGGS